MKKNTKESGSRIWEIDLLRGFAVLGMIIFHTLYLLNYESLITLNLFEGFWDIFANITRILFFLIVGISMVLSWQKNNLNSENSKQKYYKKQLIKSFHLILLGLCVSFFSLLFIPEQIILFGVLSFIGTSIFFLIPFVFNLQKLIFFTISLLLLGNNFSYIILENSFSSYILGLNYTNHISSVDYFPLYPWIFYIIGGAFLGHFLFEKTKRKYKFPNKNFIFFEKIGQKALFIYIFHIPLIAALIYILKFIFYP